MKTIFGATAAQAQETVPDIVEPFSKIKDPIVAPFKQALTDISAVLDQIIAKIDDVVAKIGRLGGGDLGASVVEAPGAGGGIETGLVAGFQKALSQIEGMIETANQNIVTAFQSLGPRIEGIGTALIAPFQQAAQGINAIIDDIIKKIQTITQVGAGPVGEEVGAGAGVGGGGVFSGMVAAAKAAVSQITAEFQGLQASITQALSSISSPDPFLGLIERAGAAVDVVTAAFDGLGEVLTKALRGAEQGVAQIMANIQNIVQAGFQSLNQVIVSVGIQVQATIAQIIAALQQAVAEVQGLSAATAFAGGGRGGGFASGGYTGNIGTRQIAGVVHGGEYVQPARVVRQPGVLQFMETLRRVGDLRKAIQLFARGFNVGGLVDNFNARLASLAIPQFAGGGLVPAVASNGPTPDFGTVTVDFGQGRRAQIITDEDSVRALRRIAIQNQILSGGREV